MTTDMDPTATLNEIREIIKEYNNGLSGPDYEEQTAGLLMQLSSSVESLDEWLSQGGFAPDQWDLSTSDQVDAMLDDQLAGDDQ